MENVAFSEAQAKNLDRTDFGRFWSQRYAVNWTPTNFLIASIQSISKTFKYKKQLEDDY